MELLLLFEQHPLSYNGAGGVARTDHRQVTFYADMATP